MSLYKIDFNEVGIAYVISATWEEAILSFSKWYKEKFKPTSNENGKFENPITKISILVGDVILQNEREN